MRLHEVFLRRLRPQELSRTQRPGEREPERYPDEGNAVVSYQLSGLLPGDNGIAATVNKMIGAVHWSLNNYDIRKRAEFLIASCPERDEKCEVTSIFNWVLRHYRYVKDPKFLEMFKSPEIADQEINFTGTLQGDCDDVSAYLVALCMSIGYNARFVVIAIQGQDDEFRHIYPQIFLPRSRRWFTLEATARQQPAGWEAPQGSRRREFPV